MDVISLVSHKRNEFGVKEKFMTKQIIDAIELFDDCKNYLGFYNEEHISNILRNICEHYSEHPFGSALPLEMTEEDKFKRFLRLDDLKVKNKTGDVQQKEETTNKFAMLMSLFPVRRGR